MMRYAYCRRATRLLAVLGMTALVTATGMAQSPVRVAVLAGEGKRTPQPGVVELLEVDVSGRDGVVILERDAIDKVLAEQGLAAAGIADPTTAIGLGRLLGVDLFAFVEKLPLVKPEALHVQVVETRTGIVLHNTVLQTMQLEEDVSVLAVGITLALEKFRSPWKDRRYIGVLGFRSEDLGSGLDGVVSALGTLLTTDLNRSPSLVVLDREHLERLTNEEDLAGADVDLKSSAVVVSGAIRTDTNGDDWVIRTQFRSGGKDAGERLVLSAPRGDIPAARRLLAAAVRKRLQAVVPEHAPMDPKKEAAMLSRQVDILTGRRYGWNGTDRIYLRAPRAVGSEHLALAEAAYALDPSQENLLVVAQMAPDPRGKRLFYRYWRNEYERRKAKGEAVALPDLEPYPKANSAAARAVPYETIRLELETLRYELACRAVDGHWLSVLNRAGSRFSGWCASTEEWGYYLKRLIEISLSAPYPETRERMAVRFMRHTTYRFGARGGYNPMEHPEESEALDAVLQWMRRDKSHLTVHLYSYLMKVNYYINRGGDIESARRFLEYVPCVPVNHPSRTSDGNDPIMSAVRAAMRQIWARDGTELTKDELWNEKRRLFCRILEPVFAHGDAALIQRWLSYEGMWKRVAKNAPDPAETEAWLRAQVATLAQPARGQLEQTFWRTPTPLSVVPEPWARFSFNELQVEGTPDGVNELVACQPTAGGLLMVWIQRPSSSGKPFRIAATRLPLGGGRQELLGTTLITPNAEKAYLSLKHVDEPDRTRYANKQSTQYWREGTAVTGIGLHGDTVYIATKHDGVVVLRGGSGEVWNAGNRLPSNYIRTLCVLRGNVYFWASETLHAGRYGALLSYDPTTGTITTLASSKAVHPKSNTEEVICSVTTEHRSSLTEMDAMLADEKRNCIWVGLYSQGLWKFEPESDQLKNMELDGVGRVAQMRWCDDRILLAMRFGRRLAFEPSSRQATMLATDWSSAVFGTAEHHEDLILLKDVLIIAGTTKTKSVLRLRADSTGRATSLKALPDGTSAPLTLLARIDHESFIGASRDGRCWRIVDRGGGALDVDLWAEGVGEGKWTVLRSRPGHLSDVQVSASSTSRNSHASSIVDGDFSTCWTAAASEGAGSWLKFEFSESATIQSIALANGYSARRVPYHYSNRAQSIRFRYDDGTEDSCTLRDFMCPQEYRLPRPVRTKTVRVTIETVYPSHIIIRDHPAHLKLSEIAFFSDSKVASSPTRNVGQASSFRALPAP